MSYDANYWDKDKFKFYVRDAELMLQQLKIWTEKEKNAEEVKKIKAAGTYSETYLSTEYVFKHAKSLFRTLTGREY